MLENAMGYLTVSIAIQYMFTVETEDTFVFRISANYVIDIVSAEVQCSVKESADENVALSQCSFFNS